MIWIDDMEGDYSQLSVTIVYMGGWERTWPSLSASVGNLGLRARNTKYKHQALELEQIFLRRQS